MARSIKTSQVMKLISGGEKKQEAPEIVTDTPAISKAKAETPEPGKKPRKVITKNLEIDKLIQETPHNPSLRGIEDLNIERSDKLTKAAFKSELIDIPTLLIEEQLPVALERFKVCDCDRCKEIFTQKAVAELPNKVIKINSNEDMLKVKAALDELRPELAKILAKLCISSKINALHNEKC